MKKKVKLMLAMEDEDGKGNLTPLLAGYVELDIEDPMGNNLDELKATAIAVRKEIDASVTPDKLVIALNRLLLGEKG